MGRLIVAVLLDRPCIEPRRLCYEAAQGKQPMRLRAELLSNCSNNLYGNPERWSQVFLRDLHRCRAKEANSRRTQRRNATASGYPQHKVHNA